MVHLINALPRIGGAERLILNLAECSPQRPVPVVTWVSTDNSLRELDASGALDVIALRPFSFGAARRALRAIRAADVIHLHLFPTLYLAPFLGKRTLYTEHNTWNRRRDHPMLRPFERWLYRRLTKVVSISAETHESLVQWLGYPPPRDEVIPNGIRLDRYQQAPHRAPIAGCLVGMAARFAPEKDQATLIRAMTRLSENYRLKLGGSGRGEGELRALVRTLGLERRVEFAGVIRDMPAFFREIDLYVHSSNSDGFSIVTAEAMASGVPVLASDIEGLRDTVGSPEMLFTKGDDVALAATIRRVVENPALYEACIRRSVAQAQRFDVRRTAEAYHRAYEDCAPTRE